MTDTKKSNDAEVVPASQAPGVAQGPTAPPLQATLVSEPYNLEPPPPHQSDADAIAHGYEQGADKEFVVATGEVDEDGNPVTTSVPLEEVGVEPEAETRPAPKAEAKKS